MRKRVGKGRKSSSFLLSVGLLKDDAVVGFIWPCDKVIPECIFLEHGPSIYEIKENDFKISRQWSNHSCNH